MITLEQFADKLAIAVTKVHPELAIGLEKTGELAETLAAAYIGHERSGWAPLAQSTIEQKAKAGYPTPAPLLRTGDMRDTIKRELDYPFLTMIVGSTSPIALFQELGTSRGIPPRPFLATGMINALPFARETFNKIAVKLLSGM